MPSSRRTVPWFILAATCMTFIATTPIRANEPRKTIGRVERLDPALDDLVPNDAKMEVLCDGLAWCEGPVWVRDGGFLLFSVIPDNAIMRWDEKAGCSLYLKPAGYTGVLRRGGESGSNGLTLTSDGRRLILCQHGDRRIARLDTLGPSPKPEFVTIADRYDEKRFNSPNDVAVHSSGAIYFTDPPYGLEKNMDDPAKELPFQGVYRIAPDTKVTLLTTELERPNGIAFSPDEKMLYVANSHGPRPIMMAFPVKEDGTLGEGQEFFNAKELMAKYEGACDGLKVDARGNLFATVPGGVAVIAPDGKHLGTLLTGKRTSNCAFGENGATLFITADDTLLRVRLTTKGAGY